MPNELFDRETLDEIGRVFQELYAEAGKEYDQHCDEHSVRPNGPAPKWNDYVRNVFEQLIERGLLIPRAELAEVERCPGCIRLAKIDAQLAALDNHKEQKP